MGKRRKKIAKKYSIILEQIRSLICLIIFNKKFEKQQKINHFIEFKKKREAFNIIRKVCIKIKKKQ